MNSALIDRVDLVPIEPVEIALLEPIQSAISRLFHLQVRIENMAIPTSQAYDRGREQYRSRDLVQHLNLMAGITTDRVLGVTGLDLYCRGLNFVFGEAMVGGRAAVVSLARLAPGPSDPARARELLTERAVKVSIHELGHTLGLEHCTERGCVMRFSNNVTDVDEKKSVFCDGCRRQAMAVVRFRD